MTQSPNGTALVVPDIHRLGPPRCGSRFTRYVTQGYGDVRFAHITLPWSLLFPFLWNLVAFSEKSRKKCYLLHSPGFCLGGFIVPIILQTGIMYRGDCRTSECELDRNSVFSAGYTTALASCFASEAPGW